MKKKFTFEYSFNEFQFSLRKFNYSLAVYDERKFFSSSFSFELLSKHLRVGNSIRCFQIVRKL